MKYRVIAMRMNRRLVIGTLVCLALVVMGNGRLAAQPGVGHRAASAQPEAGKPTIKPWSISRGRRSVESLVDRRAELSGDGALVVRGAGPTFQNAEIHFNSEDSAVLFEAVRPSQVNQTYLRYMFVDGEPAVLGKNIRIAAAIDGAIVLPHGDDFEALRTYRETNFRGAERGFRIHDYYRHDELGEDDDNIASIVLKRGYMATLSQHPEGRGVSKVYIARERDLKIKRLPEGLLDEVSMIRVFPWRYTGKKGFAGGRQETEVLGGYWHYDWGAGGESSLDTEYVPMRHNAHWDAFEKINAKHNVTHLLGFNEPMQKDQANMSMHQCLEMWPKLQASGLRLGSPCPTDGTVDWLYKFCDEADKRGLRVDFVAVHYYRGGLSTEQVIGWLKAIHERTGRPLWVTEWNNGAPWVQGHNPTLEENARKVYEYSKAMNEQPWIERYAIFTMDGGRQVINRGVMTPVGEAYKKVPGAEAYTGR